MTTETVMNLNVNFLLAPLFLKFNKFILSALRSVAVSHKKELSRFNKSDI